MKTFMTSRNDYSIGFERLYLRRPLTIGSLHLEQVKECSIHHQLEITAHRSGDYAFIYHLSGNGYLHLGTESYPMNKSQYFCAELNGRLRIRNICSVVPVRVLIIRIHAAASKLDFSEWLGVNRSEPFNSIYGSDDGAMRELIEELVEELVERDRFTSVMAESLVRQIAVKMYRAQSTDATESSFVQDRILSKRDLVELAVHHMDQHWGEIKELSQLAQKLGYSYSHLSHVFRDVMGQSLQTYWVHKRAQQAMNLLEGGEMSISQLAELLHYQSVHSFSKAFKKITGKTPREYQSEYH